MEVKKSPTNPTSSTLCVHCAPQSSMTLRTTDGDNKQSELSQFYAFGLTQRLLLFDT